ncbi:MAG: hypothetical protein C4547_16685 [Phycisphaerales bacterium]|nr:MAG: hypothetical protein C4547_16685 [Phycisphaerales bacterium]
MFQRFWSIAKVSFLETVRQPIYGVLLITTAILMMMNVSLAAFTLEDDDKLLLDLGLSTLLLSGLFLAAFSAAGVLSREIENRTAVTVISKPVSRPLFMLGKFMGLSGAILLAQYLGLLMFILCQRHGVLQNTRDPWDMPVIVFGFGSVIGGLLAAAFANYFYGKDFPLSALTLVTPLLTVSVIVVGFFSEKWEVIHFGDNYVGGQVIIAAFFVLLINLMLEAVATAASTRCGQLATLLICVVFLGTAIVSDYTFGQREGLSSALYHVTPNVGPLWIVDGLTGASQEGFVPFSYVGWATLYALLITAGVLSIGVALFQRREVG